MANMINTKIALTDKELEMVNGGGILDWISFGAAPETRMTLCIKGTPGGNGDIDPVNPKPTK